MIPKVTPKITPREAGLESLAILWSAAALGGVNTCQKKKAFAFKMIQSNKKIRVEKVTGILPVLASDH